MLERREVCERGMLLDIKPQSGGETMTVVMSNELHSKLAEHVDIIKANGARANAGVGTVIRWIMASAMELARNRQGRAATVST